MDLGGALPGEAGSGAHQAAQPQDGGFLECVGFDYFTVEMLVFNNGSDM